MQDARLQKDAAGNWNLVPSVPEELLRNINCHKFALFVAGRISRDEMLSDPKAAKEADPSADFTFGEKARRLSDIGFMPISDAQSLRTFANGSCKEGMVYVGQILDAETNEMAHSFIVEKDSEGRFMCFDKAGFKDKFSAYEIEALFEFENYHKQKWRFVPLESLR